MGERLIASVIAIAFCVAGVAGSLLEGLSPNAIGLVSGAAWAGVVLWGFPWIKKRGPRMNRRAQLDGPSTFRIPATLVGLTVIGLVGRKIVAAQRAALEQCATGCDLYGTAAAGVDAWLATPGAVASVWVGPVPLGWIVLGGLCLFLLQFVRAATSR
jgi:hypothetical protein